MVSLSFKLEVSNLFQVTDHITLYITHYNLAGPGKLFSEHGHVRQLILNVFINLHLTQRYIMNADSSYMTYRPDEEQTTIHDQENK